MTTQFDTITHAQYITQMKQSHITHILPNDKYIANLTHIY